MTPSEWDWAVSAALADGAWWQATPLARALGGPDQTIVKAALLRLVAAGAVEQRGSYMTDGRPQFRLARRAP